MSKKMKCNICKAESQLLFNAIVLGKYNVDYFQCPNCHFIQTEEPYWLPESYSNAITDLDVGLVSRNLQYSIELEKLINDNFNSQGKFLDYAGGYGLFVRLMRDKGFNFYRQDKYCENIFANNFEQEDLPVKTKFEAVTALEVFEHLEQPLQSIETMLAYSENIIFSTELVPKKKIKQVEDWWYFTPQTGQHISFYEKRTLEFLANKYNLNYYTNGTLHLLSSKQFKKNPLKGKLVTGATEIKSLIQHDYEVAKRNIANTLENKKETEQIPEKKAVEILMEKLTLATSKYEIAESELETIKTEFDKSKNHSQLIKDELELRKSQLKAADSQIVRIKGELDQLHNSKAWKVGRFLKRISVKIFPGGSKRRKIFNNFYLQIKRIIRALMRLGRGIFEYFRQAEIFVSKIKRKKRRRINRESKKVLYIGHSYHVKTQSTAFLIEYLKKFYEVEVIADESWRGEGDEYPDLSHIDDSYLAVIFFQNLPQDFSVLKEIKNKNLLFFPMYDATSTWTYADWRKLRKFKIMNFSKTLHQKLSRWGFDSAVVQYFPEPHPFIKGKKDEAFFWQRLTNININTVEKIFGDKRLKLHIHKAIDPVQIFMQPTTDQEKKYNISYSDWFDTREEMWDLIKQKQIYVAPREYEGIGMSFLEAMAMGKAVIAVNNPTMNEYISDGKTGYLFDLSNPEKINLSNIEEVQKNTYKYMAEGYKKWEKEKRKIIDFIESE